MINVTAFNGSPRGGDGNTGEMLRHIGEGIKRAGAQFDLVELKSYHIKECAGCFACWNELEGRCAIKDDMEILIEKVKKSDIILLASPVYYHNITILMKKFLERLLPLNLAKIKQDEDGIYRHEREEAIPLIVMVSSCNLVDYSNFDVVSLYAHTIAKHLGTSLIAEIYRTEACLFKVNLPNTQIVLDECKKTWEHAGYELVVGKALSAGTIRNLRRTLIRAPFYIEYANMLAAEKRQNL